MNINDFTIAELTAAINRFPVQWGAINAAGIFRDRGVRSKDVVIEEASGTLAVLPQHEWGGEGTVASKETRKTIPLTIKQTVHEDLILPQDAQGIRAFGSEQLSGLPQELARRLQRMRARHDATLEWRKAGALKGVIANQDGTYATDLFAAFGITRPEVDFVLGTAGTDILGKCRQLKDLIEDNLKGDTMTEVTVHADPGFYDRFVQHAKVQGAFQYSNESAQRLGSDLSQTGFVFGGVRFIRFRESFNGIKLVTANEGNAFPAGTLNTFETYFAPADFNETVNQYGQPLYVKTWEVEGGRGWKVHTQSNSLPVCNQPGVLPRVFSSN